MQAYIFFSWDRCNVAGNPVYSDNSNQMGGGGANWGGGNQGGGSNWGGNQGQGRLLLDNSNDELIFKLGDFVE